MPAGLVRRVLRWPMARRSVRACEATSLFRLLARKQRDFPALNFESEVGKP